MMGISEFQIDGIQEIPVSYVKLGPSSTGQYIKLDDGTFIFHTTETELMDECYWSGFGNTREEALDSWSETLHEIWDNRTK